MPKHSYNTDKSNHNKNLYEDYKNKISSLTDINKDSFDELLFNK